jgi:hypothetical protein
VIAHPPAGHLSQLSAEPTQFPVGQSNTAGLLAVSIRQWPAPSHVASMACVAVVELQTLPHATPAAAVFAVHPPCPSHTPFTHALVRAEHD